MEKSDSKLNKSAPLFFEAYLNNNPTGIKDSDEGRTMDIKDVREKFGLKK